MGVLQSKGEPSGGGLDKVLWWVRKRRAVWDPDTCHQLAASRWDWAGRRRHCRKCWPGAGRELVGVVGTVRRRSGHHREGCKYEGIVGGQGWTGVLTTARTHCCSGGPGQWRPGSWGSWQPRGRSSPLSPHSRVWGASGRSFWRAESLLRGGSCQRSSSLLRRWHQHLRECWEGSLQTIKHHRSKRRTAGWDTWSREPTRSWHYHPPDLQYNQTRPGSSLWRLKNHFLCFLW